MATFIVTLSSRLSRPLVTTLQGHLMQRSVFSVVTHSHRSHYYRYTQWSLNLHSNGLILWSPPPHGYLTRTSHFFLTDAAISPQPYILICPHYHPLRSALSPCGFPGWSLSSGCVSGSRWLASWMEGPSLRPPGGRGAKSSGLTTGAGVTLRSKHWPSVMNGGPQGSHCGI